jgi:hypothetical protein
VDNRADHIVQISSAHIVTYRLQKKKNSNVYERIGCADLSTLPTIVMTAESSLASTEDSNESVFVRLDNRKILDYCLHS